MLSISCLTQYQFPAIIILDLFCHFHFPFAPSTIYTSQILTLSPISGLIHLQPKSIGASIQITHKPTGVVMSTIRFAKFNKHKFITTLDSSILNLLSLRRPNLEGSRAEKYDDTLSVSPPIKGSTSRPHRSGSVLSDNHHDDNTL